MQILRYLSRLSVVICVISLSGCETLTYYSQAVNGHLSLLSHSKGIDSYLNAPETPARLKTQLQKVLNIREFADRELKLPVNQQYSRYVSLNDKYVVWNVFAAPELSLTAKTWCYPVAGCASYRGYYAERNARSYAKRLATQGFDVYVAGIAAYSTLGWFKDPVLSSFVYRSDAELANLLFHELAHQRLYVKGDTLFNESFATVVAQEGVKRWMAEQDNSSAYHEMLEDQNKQQQFIDLVTTYREKLDRLYQSDQSDMEKRRQKRNLVGLLRQAHEKLKQQWGGSSNYEKWFSKDINNAQLNTVATYFDLVPALTRLLAEKDYNLEVFYESASTLSNLN